MDNLKSIKEEVMDLLNQIVIKTKGIKAPESDQEDYNGGVASILDVMDDPEAYYDKDDGEMLAYFKGLTKEQKKEIELLVYLASVHAMAKRVVDGKASSADYNEKQYYNSNC